MPAFPRHQQAPVHPMTAEQLARLGAIAGTLRDSSHWHSSTFAPADTDLLAALLASWPAPSLFPCQCLPPGVYLVLNPWALSVPATWGLGFGGSGLIAKLRAQGLNLPTIGGHFFFHGAVLDLLRLMLLHPSSAALLSARAASPSQDVLMPAIRRAAEGQPPVAANQLTALRVAVNACRHKGLFSAWLATHRSEVCP